MSVKPAYLNLNLTAARRLSDLRIQAQKLLSVSGNAATWRDVRKYGLHNWAPAFGDLSQGFDGSNERNKVPVWVTFTGEKFRSECYADQCENAPRYVKENLGYFTDDFFGETARGIVGRLTHGRFIAGYEWSCNGERVYFGEVFAEEREAAQRADQSAESFAEVEREHAARYSAAQALEDDNERYLTRLRECLALRNHECFLHVRDEISGLLESIRINRETLRDDYADVL
jgi:hypothetical protein